MDNTKAETEGFLTWGFGNKWTALQFDDGHGAVFHLCFVYLMFRKEAFGVGASTPDHCLRTLLQALQRGEDVRGLMGLWLLLPCTIFCFAGHPSFFPPCLLLQGACGVRFETEQREP
jgi:hypothetical protein